MKENKYVAIIEQIKKITSGENNLIANLSNISAILFQNLYHITWAGFYIRENDDLILGPFQGKPAVTRIRLDQGICGKCVTKGNSIIVEDVHKLEDRIIFDPDSNSEITVPLKIDNRIFGIMYLGSYKINDFTDTDIINLEIISELISGSCSIIF